MYSRKVAWELCCTCCMEDSPDASHCIPAETGGVCCPPCQHPLATVLQEQRHGNAMGLLRHCRSAMIRFGSAKAKSISAPWQSQALHCQCNGCSLAAPWWGQYTAMAHPRHFQAILTNQTRAAKEMRTQAARQQVETWSC